jgi:hypothetical protein
MFEGGGGDHMTPLTLRAKVQRHLVLAHIAEDDGQFAFVLCRAGLERAAGQRFKPGDKPLLRVTIEVIDEEAEKLSRMAAGEPCQKQ